MYDDEFELTFDMAEDNAETVKLPGKPLQPAPEAPEAPEPAGKAKEPEVPDFPDDEPTIVIPARKPREMPKQEREPVRAEPVPELAPAEVKAPEEPAAAPETPVPAIRTNGRTVLISGGDRGIGAATAKAFYEAGYRVAVLYHKNAEAAAALEKALPGCTIVQCDVASRASCELAFHAVEQALGRVDVLVSNAGIAQQKLFTDITPEEWQHMRVQPVPAGAPRDDPPQGGPNPDGEQHVGPDGRQLRGTLLSRQGGPHRPDQGTGQGRGPQWHHRQLCGPGCH